MRQSAHSGVGLLLRYRAAGLDKSQGHVEACTKSQSQRSRGSGGCVAAVARGGCMCTSSVCWRAAGCGTSGQCGRTCLCVRVAVRKVTKCILNGFLSKSKPDFMSNLKADGGSGTVRATRCARGVREVEGAAHHGIHCAHMRMCAQ